jgi:hypothetical protein
MEHCTEFLKDVRKKDNVNGAESSPVRSFGGLKNPPRRRIHGFCRKDVILKSRLKKSVLLCFLGMFYVQAQLRTSVLIQSTLEDERVEISVDKSVYFPGDTVRMAILRNDTVAAGTITPILPIEGTALKSIGRRKYMTVIPQNVIPGSYPVSLRVTDPEGRRYRYETDCVVTVEEYQDVEQLSRYVGIIPEAGSNDVRTAVTLTREQVRNLEVQFQRPNNDNDTAA